MIVGMTSGCFDLFHYSHLHYLERCRRRCDRLIVGVDSDAMVKQVKGEERPIIPQEQRLALLNALNVVDAVFVVHTLEDLDHVAQQFQVDKLFKHEGYAGLEGKIHGVSERTKLEIVPDVPGMISTTSIVERIREWGRREASG